jgi:biotin operon repressor
VTLIEALTTTPLTKKALAERMGTDTRSVELEVQDARLRGIPIVSNSDGYWLAQTPAEARQCAERLRNRAIRQMETAAGLDRAADNLERARLTLWSDAA